MALVLKTGSWQEINNNNNQIAGHRTQESASETIRECKKFRHRSGAARDKFAAPSTTWLIPRQKKCKIPRHPGPKPLPHPGFQHQVTQIPQGRS
jgi:hypothetical protein